MKDHIFFAIKHEAILFCDIVIQKECLLRGEW